MWDITTFTLVPYGRRQKGKLASLFQGRKVSKLSTIMLEERVEMFAGRKIFMVPIECAERFAGPLLNL